MHKQDLIDEVRRRSGWMRESDARATVDLIFGIDGVIADALDRGEPVVITGFGTFDTRSYSERVMTNPRGGEPIDVQSGRRAVFRPGKTLRDRVQPDIRLWPVHR